MRLFVYGLVAFTLVSSALGNERRFGYAYEATVAPQGQFELENWITYSHGTTENSDARRLQFRHELEYGLTDRLQLGVYLATWSWSDAGRGAASETKYDDSAVVLKANYLDPTVAAFGLASYHEVKIGDEHLEFENKLLLQKNVDALCLVYNLTLEAEWEGRDLEERSGEIVQSAGLSYEFSPRFLVGAETVHEIPLPDWETGAEQNLFLGPNASYRFGGSAGWWMTLAAQHQVAGPDDEPELQVRMIFGVSL